MKSNTQKPVSISDTSRNFLQSTQPVDETGAAIVFKGDTREFTPTGSQQSQQEQTAETGAIERIARRLLMEYRQAFEELAK